MTKQITLSSPPKIEIPERSFSTNTFTSGDKVWTSCYLVDQSKNLPVFDLPIAGIDLSADIWNIDGNPLDLAYHIKAVNNTDLQYPIILDDRGFIMDGWHRVTKAIVEGHTTIKAVRFMKTPPHCYVKEESNGK